jgi:HK97 family phage major capsid protein
MYFGIIAILAVFACLIGIGMVADPAGALSLGGMLPLFAIGPVMVGKDLKGLQGLCKKAQGELETIKGQVESASAKGEEGKDEHATALRAYESKKLELKGLMDQLESAVEEAKQNKRLGDLMGDAEAMTKAVPPDGTNLSGGQGDDGSGGSGTEDAYEKMLKKIKAEAQDYQRKEMDKEELFFKFVQSGTKGMGDRALDVLQPSNKDLSKNSEGPVAVIPGRIMDKMFPGLFRKALPMTSHDTDIQGGRANLLYPDYGTQILQLPSEEPSLFMRVTKKPVTGGSLVETRLVQDDENEFGGVEVEWTDEETDAPDTEMEVERITINCHPLKAYTSFTKVLLGRSRWDFEGELVDKLRKAMTAKFDYAIMHGTGVKMPLGIRMADGIRTTARGTAGAVAYADLNFMKHAVLPHHRSGATWFMDDTVLQALEGTVDTLGRPIFSQSVGSGPLDRMLNYPWFVNTRCSSIGNPGDIIFGNLQHYWFCIEEEIVIARSEHAEFKKGGIAYRIDALAGGRPMFERAFDILVGAGS